MYGAVLANVVLWAGCAHTPKPSGPGTLIGKVVDERGRGVGGAGVRLEGFSTESLTGAYGGFRLHPVPAGNYRVEVGETNATSLTRFKEAVRIHGGRVTEIELTLPDREPELFGQPVDSLAGRYHRIAFLPMSDWYMPNSRRDSVRTVLEPRLVQHLRSSGFEVVERDLGVAICMRVADSLGGNFDRRKGRVDREREAELLIHTRLRLMDQYRPDCLIFWGLSDHLSVHVEDGGGRSIYMHKVNAGVRSSPEEIASTRQDYSDILEAVLDPFCRAVQNR